MASSKTIFQLPDQPSWFENISIRPNGTVLATRLGIPEVWAIDPKTGSGKPLVRLPESAPQTGLTGICEISPDVFALGSLVFDFAGAPKETLCAVWKADLTGAEPVLTKVADTPDIGMINGIATWDANTILVTDCFVGKVYKLDMTTGAYELALEDESMTLPPNAPMPYAINGIKVHRTGSQTYIYYTTTTRASLYRLPVTADIKAAGPVETLGSGFGCDDFAIARDGTVYLCTHVGNSLLKITAGSEPVTVAGAATEMTLAGSTACVFGEDEKVLYVSTTGAASMPVDGKTEGAKVVEVRLA